MKKQQVLSVCVTWEDCEQERCDSEEGCCGEGRCENTVPGTPANWSWFPSDENGVEIDVEFVVENYGPVVDKLI